METRYFIFNKEYESPLFSLDYCHKNEGPVVHDIAEKLKIIRDLALEDAIRDLYGRFCGRYNHISNPIDLLGILLANGFALKAVTKNESTILFKDYFHISFEARSNSKTIKIGNYYRTSVTTADEQFVAFNKWLDQQTGFNGMGLNMIHQFISSGLSIVATETDSETVLLPVSPDGSVRRGLPHTTKYLFGSDF